MCSTASLAQPKSIFYLNCFAVQSVPTLFDRLLDYTELTRLRRYWRAVNERIGAWESKIASGDAETVANLVQFIILDRRYRAAEEEAWPLLTTVQERGPKLLVAEVACSRAQTAL